MIIKFGNFNLFKYSEISLAETILLLYISSIIIISMMPIGNLISKIIGFLFIFYFVIFHHFWYGKKIQISNALIPIYIWFIFCVFSGLFAKDIFLFSSKILTIFQLILFFIAGYSLINAGRITEKQVFYTFIISTVIVIIYGALTYEPISGFIYKNRIASTTGNPNNLAVFGAFAFIFCLFLFIDENKLIKKIVLLLFMSILVYGIINTHSRQGIVILIGSTIIYSIIRAFHNYKISNNKLKYLRNGLLLSSVLILIFVISFQMIKESAYYFRIQTLLSFLQTGINTSTVSLAKLIDYSAYERSQFIIYGTKIWLDNLVFGVGLDNFKVVIREYWPISNRLYSHNNYIELLSTIGTFGATAYYAIYYYIIKKLLSLLKSNYLSDRQRNLIHIFFTAILSIMVVELVTVTYPKKFTWVILVIILGFTSRMYRKNILQS